jgi:hypothetical protein
MITIVMVVVVVELMIVLSSRIMKDKTTFSWNRRMPSNDHYTNVIMITIMVAVMESGDANVPNNI